MSNRVLASVVLNNYNYARFLRQAIDSALAQTYTPLEVVVVDDGSTDESRAIIESYGNRVRAVLQQNGGMAAALNAGFRACRGDIVVFLDSDDLLLPTAVAAAAELLNDPEVVRVHWRMREMDGTGTDTGRFVPSWPLPEGNLRALVIEKGPMRANGSPTSGNAWPRWFLEQVLPIPEHELRQHADAHLNTLASVFGIIRQLPEPHGRYRVHGGNDYAGQPALDRLRRNLHMYHYRCRLLGAQLRAVGVEIEPAAWKLSVPSYYSRLARRVAVLQEIAALVPAGATFILVDDGAFGPGVLIADRVTVRLMLEVPHHESSPSSQAALEQIERSRAEGADFIVFAPDLSGLNSRPDLRRYLESRYSCELSTESLVAFNLGS